MVNGTDTGQPLQVGHAENNFYEVRQIGTGVVVRRTSQPHTALDEIDRAFAAVYRKVAALPIDRMPLLVDLRDVVGRNDPEFERAVAPHRRRLVTSFGRAAILVRSSIGTLQIKRLFSDEGIEIEVFTDPNVAFRWLGVTEDPDA